MIIDSALYRAIQHIHNRLPAADVRAAFGVAANNYKVVLYLF